MGKQTHFDGNILSTVFSFLTPMELLAADTVSSLWHDVVAKMWRFVKDMDGIKHLTYKPCTFFPDKQLCARSWQASSGQRCGTMMIVGGTREHPNSSNSIFCFDDTSSELRTSQTNRLQFPSRLSSAASCVTSDGHVMTLGGWNGIEAVSSTYSYRYHVDKFDGAVSWQQSDELPYPTCFAAAAVTLSSHVLLSGGGDSIWKGAQVYDQCLLYNSHSSEWRPIANMTSARCGHTALTQFNGHVTVMGGYGGGTTYYTSVESYVPDIDAWIQLPEMRTPRSGCGSGYSPQGALYVVGGSSNGLTGLRTVERFDPREGKWEGIGDMVDKRGYTCASFGGGNLLYVAGGISKDNFKPSVEYLDVRMNKWQYLSHKSAILGPKIQKTHLRRADCQMVYLM